MSFALLALICAVAILGPLVSLNKVLHVPVVIGELAVGILLGQTGLRMVDAADPTLAFMAQIGFALVMFVAGTHVPVRQKGIGPRLGRGLARALLVGVLAVPAGLLIAHLAGNDHGGLYAVLLASSSAGVVMPALGAVTVGTAPGLEMLAQLAVADAGCIVALPLVLDPAHVLRAVLGSLTVLVLAAVFWLLLRWSERAGYRHRIHELSEERGLAMELRVTLTMLFVLAAVAASMHVSVMLAGFAMGLAMAAVGEPRRIAHQTFALTEGFFAPIFFVWLGASLDLRTIAGHPQIVVLGLGLGVAAVLVHSVGVLTRQPWPLAATTSAQLGVPVGAAALGTTMGVLGTGEATAMLLGALVTIGVVTVLSGRVGTLVAAPVAAAGTGPGAGPGA